MRAFPFRLGLAAGLGEQLFGLAPPPGCLLLRRGQGLARLRVGPVTGRLGLGAQPVGLVLGVGAEPQVAEWGNMIAAGRGFMGVKDYMWTYPSIAIVVTALGFILFGNGLRDALDPKLR